MRIMYIWFMLMLISFMLLLGMEDRKNRKLKEEKIIEEVKKLSEYGYFEGQKDAILGDVRISLNNDKWIWTKSPWDNSDSIRYIPPVATEKEKKDYDKLRLR